MYCPYYVLSMKKLEKNLCMLEPRNRLKLQVSIWSSEKLESNHKVNSGEKFERKRLKFSCSNQYERKEADKEHKSVKIDSDEVENGKASRYFQYALMKGLSTSTILSCPLTSRPIFLPKSFLELESTKQSGT